MNKFDLKIGQLIWVKSYTGKGLDQYSIDRIGRKWAFFNHGRDQFNMETLRTKEDYRGSTSQVYLDLAEYNAERKLESSWSEIRTYINENYRCPEHLTIEKLNAVKDLLGMESK